MQVLELQKANIQKATALALGYFDAFHLGHRQLLDAVVASGYPAALLTFSGDFYGALGEQVKPLYTWRQRCRFAEAYGIEYMLTLAADSHNLSLSPAVFLDLLLGANPAHIVCGLDFRFGRGAAGDVAMLRSFCQVHGISLTVLPILTDCHGKKIGTAAIRQYVMDGDMSQAHAMLGRPYSIEGVVQHGRGDGHRLGFPTANIPLDPACQAPKDGVYACTVQIGQTQHAAVCNIGVHPTLGDYHANVECYLLRFHADLYGQTVTVHFVKRMRDIRQFSSLRDLQQQIELDCQSAMQILGDTYD